MNKKLYPLKFTPIFKEKIWGGRNLEKCLNKNLPPDINIGESWEISDYGKDKTIIANGLWQGFTISQLMEKAGELMFGKKIIKKFNNYFPLLIKFIDARERLSIQVHPDDEFALQNENSRGKTEMWYIVDAEPNAKLICGFKQILAEQKTKSMNKKLLEQIYRNGNLETTLNKININKGDSIFIPSGCIHAIMEGILLVEIQESSDLTYRLYDWQRLDTNGHPRKLHIEKALNVINYKYRGEKIIPKQIFNKNGAKDESLLRCKYFEIDLITLEKNSIFKVENITNGERFIIYIILEGSGYISYNNNQCRETYIKGESILLPAAIGNFSIIQTVYPNKMLQVYIP